MEPPLHRVATTPRTRMSIPCQVQTLLLLRGPVRTRFLSTPLTYPRPQPQSPILLPLQMNVAKRHQGGNLINGPGPIQVWNLRLPVRMKMVLSQQFHLCEAQKLILSDCKYSSISTFAMLKIPSIPITTHSLSERSSSTLILYLVSRSARPHRPFASNALALSFAYHFPLAARSSWTAYRSSRLPSPTAFRVFRASGDVPPDA